MDAQTEAAYDGNLLAGPLSDVFGVEITTAVGRCRGCGSSSQVATFRVYGPDPGFVGRCPSCESVLMLAAHEVAAANAQPDGWTRLMPSRTPTRGRQSRILAARSL